MKYRREIDGLRAIAVLPVIFFHAGFEIFSGGFVGVDIFFVISGYLITTIILSDIENKQFSIINFYERRSRRILPALFFVILCCLPFAWLWLSPSHLKSFSDSLVAVPAFFSNFLFWKESGYFDSAAELKPLLHTWSLAVEEQYYIVFPLFLMLMWKLRKRFIFGSLLIIAAASLGVAQWGAYKSPSATFFLLHTRMWELAIGALIAFYFLYKRNQLNSITSRKSLNEAFSLLGIFLIFYSVFIFDSETPFPSAYALLPTLGAGFIIIFSTAETLVGRILGSKILVGIGLISYSMYLWHQPLFVFARHKNIGELNSDIIITLIITSVVLAYLTWRYIEQPFRNKETFSRKNIFHFSLAGSLILITIGTIGHKNDGFTQRFNIPDSLVKSFKMAELDSDTTFNIKNIHLVDNWFTTLGIKTARPSFVVFGDSHASALAKAFDQAAKNNNLSGIFAGTSGCPPLLEIHALRKDQDTQNCHLLNKRAYEYVRTNKIKKAFLVARWSYYTDGDYYETKFSHLGLSKNTRKNKENSRHAFEVGVKKTVEFYKNIGTELIVLSQVPQQLYSAEDLYINIIKSSNDENAINRFSITKDRHLQLQSFATSTFRSNDYISLVYPDKIFCNDNRCRVGTIDKSYYLDSDHLSKTGSELLTPLIEQELRKF